MGGALVRRATLILLSAAPVCLAAGAGEAEPPPEAEGLRVSVRNDASVHVVDLSSPGQRPETPYEIALEFVPLAQRRGGPEVNVYPSFGRRPARLVIGDRTLLLSAKARAVAGGILMDFRATPAPREGADAPWYKPLEVRVGVVVRLPGAALRRARGFLGGRYVDLAGEKADDAGLSPLEPGEKKLLKARAWGRGIRLAPERGRELVVEGELPGEVKLEETDGGDFVLRLAAAETDTATPVAFAVFVGRWAYEGRPVLLERPRVSFLAELGCFEVRLRAFGRWRDPFDSSDVTVEVAWRAGSTRGRATPGFYARDFRVVAEEAEDGSEHERLVGLGWPGFRSRLSATASGGTAVVAFVTRSGRTVAEAAVPSGRLWPLRGDPAGRPASSGVTLGSSDWRSTRDAAKAIFELNTTHVRAARLPVYEGAYALEADVPGETDLAAAWRLDRAFEEAGKRALKLFPVLGRGRPADEFRASSPYFSRAAPLARTVGEFFAGDAARAAFRRKLRYAAARWRHVDALGGWEVFDGPDLLSGRIQMRALVEWLDEMTEVLRAADPRHSVSVTLRTDASAEPRALEAFDRLRERLVVGRSVEPGGAKARTVEAAFASASTASARADYLLLDVPDEPVHAALWSAAAGARKRVFLGGSPRESTASLARYFSDGSSPGELGEAFSFRSSVCLIVGSRGPEGASWWITRLPIRELTRKRDEETPDPAGPEEEAEPGEEEEKDVKREPQMLPVLRDVAFDIDSLRDGRYRIEWWQPHQGRLLTTVKLRAVDGSVAVEVPPFTSDLAGRLSRISGDSSHFGK